MVRTENDTALAAQEKVGGLAHRTTPATVDERSDGTATGYMALKPMKVNGQQVQPGSIVPEAVHWRNVHNYVSTGHLAPVLLNSNSGGGGRF